jgi:hypothetical protein
MKASLALGKPLAAPILQTGGWFEELMRTYWKLETSVPFSGIEHRFSDNRAHIIVLNLLAAEFFFIFLAHPVCKCE